MKYFVAGCLFVFISCSSIPENYKAVLTKAGDNRSELEKVIAYYDSVGDPEKLKVAYLLISSMDRGYYWDGEVVSNFDSIFRYLDSLHRNMIYVNVQSPLLVKKWEELIELYGPPDINRATKKMDHRSINSEFIISHID